MNNIAVRIPLDFDPDRLSQDLAVCETELWKEHFHAEVYSGRWNSIALYSPSGRADDIFTENNDLFRPTPLLEHCPYFCEVLDSMLFTKQSVRLLCLGPGSQIKTHRDLGLSYPMGIFRLHIPLSTDDEVEFIVGDRRLTMHAGECWYGDFDQPHSVNNRGKKDRIHLVIDGERNEWTNVLFEKAGYDFAEEKQLKNMNADTKSKVIQELLAMNTPASRSLAEKLKNE